MRYPLGRFNVELQLIYGSIAVAGLSLALYFYRQLKNLNLVLREGAKGFEALQQRLKFKDSESMNLLTKLQALEEASREQAARLRSLAHENQNLKQGKDSQIQNWDRKIADVTAQRDHAMAMAEKINADLSQQLAQQAQDLSRLQERYQSLAESSQSSLRDVESTSVQQMGQLKAELVSARRELHKTTKELQQYKGYLGSNPKDYDTLRRRLGHAQTLYHSMKSLRELADERNQNWESALRQLAQWIVENHKDSSVQHREVAAKSIGPLVGQALELIGSEIQTPQSPNEGASAHANIADVHAN
jgi:chromosome segregation ATPase